MLNFICVPCRELGAEGCTKCANIVGEDLKWQDPTTPTGGSNCDCQHRGNPEVCRALNKR